MAQHKPQRTAPTPAPIIAFAFGPELFLTSLPRELASSRGKEVSACELAELTQSVNALE